MKQKIFTLIMMLALVIVAGKAFAQNTSVTQGGTYDYTLSDITVLTQGVGTITYSGAGATIQDVTGFTGSAPNWTVPTGGISLGFNIVFSGSATSGTITVTVQDGSAGTCSNYIELAITVLPAPTIDASIAGDADFCQATQLDPANNVAASDTTSSFDFDVSTAITDIPADYDATITVAFTGGGTTNLGAFDVEWNGDGIYTGDETGGTIDWDEGTAGPSPFTGTFTVTFNTTTGLAPQTVTATLSSVSITENGGGQTYNESGAGDNDDDVVVRTMPSIGTFQP